MSAEIGKPAPDFTLVSSDLKRKSLKDYRGSKTLLLFFPGAFTSVCTKELCTVRDSLSKFNNVGAKVVGISVDAPFSLAQFGKENNLAFDLLSDATREVSRKYGALHENFVVEGLFASKRAAFIIDGSGIVRYRWVSEDPKIEPNYDELIKELGKAA